MVCLDANVYCSEALKGSYEFGDPVAASTTVTSSNNNNNTGTPHSAPVLGKDLTFEVGPQAHGTLVSEATVASGGEWGHTACEQLLD